MKMISNEFTLGEEQHLIVCKLREGTLDLSGEDVLNILVDIGSVTLASLLVEEGLEKKAFEQKMMQKYEHVRNDLSENEEIKKMAEICKSHHLDQDE